MEDVIQQLQERAQETLIPLELPDMDQLVEVEEQLYISLPHDFREFLLEASDLVVGSLEPVTATDPQSHTFLPEVAAQAWDLGLPRDLLPVCEANGGYFAIADSGTVTFWRDGETDERDWASIWYWAREVWLES